MANIHSISLNNELEKFIGENPALSLSKVCQAALYNIKEQTEHQKIRIKVLENKLIQLQQKLYEANEEIEKLKGGKN